MVPTRDRAALLREAVDSALGQVGVAAEVLVVDDGSAEPVALPAHPRLRVVQHLRPRGVSAARNTGTALATTPLVAFLDDDDVLRPHMLARSLAGRQAALDAGVPGPVGVLSAVAVVDPAGRVEAVRRPPRLSPRGAHFDLEPAEPGASWHCKQTLVVPRDVLVAIGGFDESFASRVVTELFWRLNPVCALVGLPDVTYELRSHPGPRISTDRALRSRSFARLLRTHRALLRDHPRGYADLLARHARTCVEARRPLAAAAAVTRLAGADPTRAARALRAVSPRAGGPGPDPR